jgi:transcriptional regulator with GAF, ATPase, and Fis domain
MSNMAAQARRESGRRRHAPLGGVAGKQVPLRAEAVYFDRAFAGRRNDLGELEREHILEVLRQTGWRIEGPKGAALKLGLNPSTLRSRMLKLKLQKTGKRERQGASPAAGI